MCHHLNMSIFLINTVMAGRRACLGVLSLRNALLLGWILVLSKVMILLLEVICLHANKEGAVVEAKNVHGLMEAPGMEHITLQILTASLKYLVDVS